MVKVRSTTGMASSQVHMTIYVLSIRPQARARAEAKNARRAASVEEEEPDLSIPLDFKILTNIYLSFSQIVC
jgi:hypothetical protein